MPNVRWHYALVLAALLPLAAAAQTIPENGPPSPTPREGWAASPLERVLARSGELTLTSEQVERLNAGVERWRIASAEPLAALRDVREGREARQGREAMTALRDLRQEQMTLLREVLTGEQLQSLQRERMSAREGRPGRWGTDRPGPRRPGGTPQPPPQPSS